MNRYSPGLERSSASSLRATCQAPAEQARAAAWSSPARPGGPAWRSRSARRPAATQPPGSQARPPPLGAPTRDVEPREVAAKCAGSSGHGAQPSATITTRLARKPASGGIDAVL